MAHRKYSGSRTGAETSKPQARLQQSSYSTNSTPDLRTTLSAGTTAQANALLSFPTSGLP